MAKKTRYPCDKTFDTLGLIATAAPTEAREWINQETGDQPVAFIDLKAQQDAIRPGIERNIFAVLKHGRYVLSPEVRELEERLCEYTGAGQGIGVSSGTDALLLALMAWEIGPGDAVTTPFTFIATSEIIQTLGATSVFVDIDPRTFNIDPEKLGLAIEAVKKNDPPIHTMQATILPAKLDIFPEELEAKRRLAENYTKMLSDNAPALTPPHVPDGLESAWAQYSILAQNTEQRRKIQEKLKEPSTPQHGDYPKPLQYRPLLPILTTGQVIFRWVVATSERTLFSACSCMDI